MNPPPHLKTSASGWILAGFLAFGVPATPARASIDHLDCAAHYGALSLTLPYLPGIFMMFRIAPRASEAWRVYRAETPPDEQRPRRGFFAIADRRKRDLVAAHEAGELTLEEIIATVHACDAQYGLDPVPVTLNDFLERE